MNDTPATADALLCRVALTLILWISGLVLFCK